MDIHTATEIAFCNGYEKGYADALDGWISVKERLPEENVRVLVHLRSDRSFTIMETDSLVNGKWLRNGVWIKLGAFEVTHWMPLPLPPKEGE